MAFCTKCGTKLEDNARFCTACGTTQGAAAPAAPPAYAAPPAPMQVAPAPVAAGVPAPTQGSGALKIILIILGVLAILFVLMLGTCSLIAYRARRAFHTSTDGNHTTVTTPFGTVTSDQGDAAKAAADLGVDVYPGAKSLRSSTASIGKMNVVTADFETGDSVSQVGEFYRGRFPNALSSAWDESHGSMVVPSNKGMLTINVRAEGGRTKIIIGRTTGIPTGPTGSN
ncbi:MAG: zinc ribbon domain-containing protein [Terriglobales bacterium]